MIHGSLFSGIGGFDLAAEWMGWENAFHCEWNEFGQKILKYYWPNAKSYEDITKTDFTIWRGKIDILTGGFPCQPYSVAGKRKGKEDERHLWPEMLRAIREIQPSYVVGENVYGLVNWNGGLVFDEVQFDLENEGYQVQPVILPACGVNAPHRRERVWFVANAKHNGNIRESRANEKESSKKQIQERNEVQRIEKPIGTRPEMESFITNSNDTRTGKRLRTNGDRQAENEGRKRQPQSKSGKDGRHEFASNTKIKRFQKRNGKQTQYGTHATIERYNGFLQWENFPTQPPICSRNDGLSNQLDGITFPKWRSESIKGYGNAIVPQVAFEIFKAINQTI